MSQLDLSWDVVDEWWLRYTSGLTGELVELHDVLRELNEQWEASACPFDVDPLAINWTTDIPQSGPLRTNQEENWSRWLAQLIRDSMGAFTTAVFGTELDPQALQVRCEKAFQDEQLHDRRVDSIAQSVALPSACRVVNVNSQTSVTGVGSPRLQSCGGCHVSRFILIPDTTVRSPAEIGRTNIGRRVIHHTQYHGLRHHNGGRGYFESQPLLLLALEPLVRVYLQSQVTRSHFLQFHLAKGPPKHEYAGQGQYRIELGS